VATQAGHVGSRERRVARRQLRSRLQLLGRAEGKGPQRQGGGPREAAGHAELQRQLVAQVRQVRQWRRRRQDLQKQQRTGRTLCAEQELTSILRLTALASAAACPDEPCLGSSRCCCGRTCHATHQGGCVHSDVDAAAAGATLQTAGLASA
jgi:hypothetical protein